MLLLAALSVAGVVSAASASLGAPKVLGVSAYAYVAPVRAYDGVARGCPSGCQRGSASGVAGRLWWLSQEGSYD